MRAARYHGPEDVRIEEIESRPLESNELRVDVAACGICGSDLHEYAAGPITVPEEPHPVTGESLPLRLGHEIGGTVAEVGEDVDLAEGTTVAINPIIYCGECRYCDQGDYHLCDSNGFVGLSGAGGGFAEEIVVDAERVVPVPDGVPPELAALVEPFTVGLHAIHQSGLEAGDAVAVFGSGPIGLTVVQAARAAGAGPIFVSEPNDARRELAAECGADVLIDPIEDDPEAQIVDEIGRHADVAFEVAGIEATVNQAIRATKPGGTTVIVSLFEETVAIHPNDLVMKERTLVGTAAFEGGPLSGREFETTIRNIATGDLDPELLVTSRIDLENLVDDGFEQLLADDNEHVKILVRP
ncbi:2,3-butanediol dehydrogenase [Natrarchaeobius sp. A-rgal3]|uniref:2,3-butanediol dehydrogenase n=1 Tax=Natrarchaeobius versutus TaxID=1679078 RepID=UPI0035107E07